MLYDIVYCCVIRMLLAAETTSLVVPIRGYLPALRESVGVKSGEFKAHTHDREHLYNALHLNGEMNGKGRKTRRLRQMGGLCEAHLSLFQWVSYSGTGTAAKSGVS